LKRSDGRSHLATFTTSWKYARASLLFFSSTDSCRLSQQQFEMRDFLSAARLRAKNAASCVAYFWFVVLYVGRTSNLNPYLHFSSLVFSFISLLFLFIFYYYFFFLCKNFKGVSGFRVLFEPSQVSIVRDVSTF
jgi:hypothetical protein